MCPISSKTIPKFKKKVIDLQRIDGSIFSDTYLTVQRAFVAILPTPIHLIHPIGPAYSEPNVV